MTVREAIASITHDYSKGVPSDDSRLRPRRVYAALLNARADVLYKRGLTKMSNEHNFTTLPCVPIVEASHAECPCIPIPNCYNFRTECQIPIPLGEGDGLIQDVTTYDGSIRFSRIDFGQVRYLGHERYTGKQPKYYIRNRYLYLINVPERLKIITIRLLAEDPSDAGCSLCGSSQASPACFPLDQEFSIDRKYFGAVKELAIRQLFATSSPQDAQNNAIDNSTPAIQQSQGQ
jgi:hypothetical protein